MSHEIRTPMNSIIGFSELALGDDDLSKKTKSHLTNILESSKWLLQIINDIFDISEIESGNLELENIPLDLDNLFANCRNAFMPGAVEKGLDISFKAEPLTGVTLLGDPKRLQQAIMNLVSNALKFTDSGTIKVSSNINDIGNRCVSIHFEVVDSGIGMTPDQIKGIFEPFTQAETGMTRKYGGTGLGLAITKNLIKMMGGELEVASTPGIGSYFSFDLTFETKNGK
jgi:signal transduction histidine kinase